MHPLTSRLIWFLNSYIINSNNNHNFSHLKLKTIIINHIKMKLLTHTLLMSRPFLKNELYRRATTSLNNNSIRCATTDAATKLFSEKHEWIATQDKKIGRVGITNHAQEALGDVVYVQAPEVGSKFAQFDEVGAIESVKAASELITPVSGEIVAINEKLQEKPGLVNSDCYGEGWLYDVKLDEPQELDNLMTEEQYQKFLESGEGA